MAGEGGERLSPGRLAVARAVRIASAAALAGLLLGYDISLINSAAAALQDEFKIGNAVLGFTAAAALLGAAIGAIIIGRIADRIGRVPAMKLAAMLFFVCGVGSGLASSIWLVVIFRILGGVRLYRRDIAAADPRAARFTAAARRRFRYLPVPGGGLAAGH
jgi:MFS family permease